MRVDSIGKTPGDGGHGGRVREGGGGGTEVVTATLFRRTAPIVEAAGAAS